MRLPSGYREMDSCIIWWRIIVGTLVRVGRGFYTPEQVQEILEAKNRKAAGVTAPPQGLFLVGIEYEE